MTTKEIFLKLEKVTKSIVFASTTDRSDWDALRESMLEESLKDRFLHQQMQDSSVTFQILRKLKNGSEIFVEVKEKEKTHVDDESIIVPAFQKNILTSTDSELQDMTVGDIDETLIVNLEDGSVPIQFPDGTFLQLSGLGEDPNLFSPEPMLTEQHDRKCSEETKPQEDSEENKPQEGTEESKLQGGSEESKLQEGSEGSKQQDQLSSDKNKVKIAQQPKKKAAPRKTLKFSPDNQVTSLGESFQIPSPPDFYINTSRKENQSILEFRKIMKKLNARLIAYYGNFLFKSTREPTKGDYDFVGKLICDQHPSLKDDSSRRPHHIVCKQLSAFIRNRKTGEKTILSQNAEQQDPEPRSQQPRKKVKKTLLPVLAECHENMDSTSDCEDTPLIDKAVEELDKVSHRGSTPHVLRLLRLTFPRRVKWITAHANSCSDVVKKFPLLAQPELVLNELQLRVKIDIPVMIEKLSNILKDTGEFLQKKTDSPVEFLGLIVFLFTYLKPKNFSKNAVDAVVLCKAFQSEENQILETSANDSPRLVIFVDEDSSIISAFLVADHSITLKIDQPQDVTRSLLILIGSYYAWDTNFPSGYRSFFFHFHEELFLLPAENPGVSYRSFRKDFLAWKKAKASKN